MSVMVQRNEELNKASVATWLAARAISKAAKLTDHRAKLVLQALLEPPEALSRQPFILPTGCMRRNAAYYEFAPWGEEIAYLPDCLWNEDARGNTALQAVLYANGSPRRRLDALYLLVTLYARMDYEWLAVPPDRFACQQALSSGTCELNNLEFALGLRAEVGDYGLWLVKIDWTDWKIADCAELFADSSATQRMLSAANLLLEQCLICRVLVADVGEFCYPLWVSHGWAAQLLQEQGIHTDLADQCRYAAEKLRDRGARAIPAQLARNPEATIGLFYCLSADRPEVCVTLMPRLHAPTRQNESAMRTMADNTARIARLLDLPGKAYDEDTLDLVNAADGDDCWGL
jgi:hypothetical protein